MLEKKLINIESEKPLNDYDDGHILIYNKYKNRYYTISRESLLSAQDNKIKNLSMEFENFKKNMEQKYADFLKTYKETNSKIISMVKSVVVEEK